MSFGEFWNKWVGDWGVRVFGVGVVFRVGVYRLVFFGDRALAEFECGGFLGKGVWAVEILGIRDF